jgi:uncharacterized protein YqkB
MKNHPFYKIQKFPHTDSKVKKGKMQYNKGKRKIMIGWRRGGSYMKIQLTDAAAEKISEKTEGRTGHLKLKYDIDGCGCVVSGVPTLWYVSEPDEIDDVAVDTNHFPILVEKSKTVFLDEELKIDFSTASNTFQLKSPGQILNGRMNFILYPGE